MIRYIGDNSDFLPCKYNEVIVYDDSTTPSTVLYRKIFMVESSGIISDLLYEYLNEEMRYKYLCYILFHDIYKEDKYSWKYDFSKNTLYNGNYSDYQYKGNKVLSEDDVREDIKYILEGGLEL